VHGLVCVGWALWLLGFPAQALQKIQHALSLMREVTLPYSFAAALSVAAVVHQFRREERAVQERAEATIALSAEQGFSFWLALGSFFRGWALAEQGQGGEGITLMKRGLADFRAAASGNSESLWLALLAETYGKAGQIEEGLTVLTEALAVAEKNEERMYEAELWRLKGELTLQSQASLGQVEDKSQASLGRVKTGPGSSDPKSQSLNPKSQVEAEEYFWRAIEIARAQQAKSLELRAVMSLARLWQSQGKQREAHHMLSEIYNWFTEGFDTKDLQEAKALLEALT
jgi:predicted ATPase